MCLINIQQEEQLGYHIKTVYVLNKNEAGKIKAIEKKTSTREELPS